MDMMMEEKKNKPKKKQQKTNKKLERKYVSSFKKTNLIGGEATPAVRCWLAYRIYV